MGRNVCVILLLLPFCVSCTTNNRTGVLEAKLRRQGEQIRQFEKELGDASSELKIAQRDADNLREQFASRGEKTLTSEQADSLYRVTSIRINDFLTGGLDKDGDKSHDELNVVIEPKDRDGETVKLAGRFEIELFDMSLSEPERHLGTWTYTIEEARTYWHRGLLGAGFKFQLPWKRLPQNKELLLHARMTTADKRQFDTTSTVRIKLSNAKLATKAGELGVRN
jgi:hypothetical protein